jgi:hypothetical protein
MIKPSQLLLLASLSPFAVLACSSDSSSATTTTGNGGSTTGAPTTTSSSAQGGAGGEGGGLLTVTVGSSTGGSACVAPEVIISLDRTLTMHKTPAGGEPVDAPDYATSKWFQALSAIKGLVTPKLDMGIHFGLEMWPKDPGMGCITLAEKVMQAPATNPNCQEGEILVPPGPGTSAKMIPLLDPKTAHLCTSTPTGQGLLTAADYLKANKKPGRDQYIMLVTDGADWEQTCPMPDPVGVLQQLAKDGIKTFMVGFSATGDIQPGGTGAPFLNDMACAGMTAKGFPDSCVMTAEGYKAKDAKGETLYLQASDGAALTTAFNGIAAELCCNCAN